MPGAYPIHPTVVPTHRRQRKILDKWRAFVPAKKLFNVRVRLNRIVLPSEQDHVVKLTPGPRNRLDALERGSDVTKAAPVTGVSLQEMDVWKPPETTHHGVVDFVTTLAIDMEIERR